MMLPSLLARLRTAVPLALASATPSFAQFHLFDELFNLGIDDAEITPNGQLVIARENTFSTSARIYDPINGAFITQIMSNAPSISGIAQDAVAVTDTRAVVIGSSVLILDLTTPIPTLFAEHDGGIFPRDVAISPDGTIAAVRGGESFGGFTGGLFLYDLATGAQIATAPGDPIPSATVNQSFDVDSVAISDTHAVFVSNPGPIGNRSTRVTIFELRPAGGGPPALVYETVPGTDQIDEPHDVALTPDGNYAAVRSGMSVGLYSLAGAASTQVWHSRLFNDPGPFGLSAMDSIEVTNDRIATISRRSNGGIGAQLDLFEINGAQRYMILTGDPHDLTFTPNGERLIVRTHIETLLYDAVNLSPSIFLTPLDRELWDGTHTSFGAAMDSIAATNDKVVTLNRFNDLTKVRIWDIRNDTLGVALDSVMPDKPIDLAITPDEARAVVSGLTYVQIYDLRANLLVLDHDPQPSGTWPWCDGVVVNDTRAVAFGVQFANGNGWVSIFDLFGEPVQYCQANANSTGNAAGIHANGSASVAANDLILYATDLPPDEFGLFVYGDNTAQVPFGSGFLCVSGVITRFPITTTTALGHAEQVVDYTALPPGAGPILAGLRWNFQYVYRDGGSGGPQFNATNGLTIDFLN